MSILEASPFQTLFFMSSLYLPARSPLCLDKRLYWWKKSQILYTIYFVTCSVLHNRIHHNFNSSNENCGRKEFMEQRICWIKKWKNLQGWIHRYLEVHHDGLQWSVFYYGVEWDNGHLPMDIWRIPYQISYKGRYYKWVYKDGSRFKKNLNWLQKIVWRFWRELRYFKSTRNGSDDGGNLKH